MENYDLKKESTTHPYGHYGRVFEVTRGDTKFLLKRAL